MELRDFRFEFPLGRESMSIASPMGPLRIETPGGPGRALDAVLSMARSSDLDILAAEAATRLVNIGAH